MIPFYMGDRFYGEVMIPNQWSVRWKKKDFYGCAWSPSAYHDLNRFGERAIWIAYNRSGCNGMGGRVADMGWGRWHDVFFEIENSIHFPMRGDYTNYDLIMKSKFKLIASEFCRDIIFWSIFWFALFNLIVLFHKTIFIGYTMTNSLIIIIMIKLGGFSYELSTWFLLFLRTLCLIQCTEIWYVNTMLRKYQRTGNICNCVWNIFWFCWRKM